MKKRMNGMSAAGLARRRGIAGSAALTAAALLPSLACANNAWPERPIKLVVPFPPGGSSDAVGRIIADALREALGATVVVENRPGGTTQIGTEIVSRAEPDGYTLLLGAATAFTVLPNLRKLPYDPENGFEILGGIADYIAIVTVRQGAGISTMAGLIEAAKREPGKLSYGSAGLASAGHIAGETIKRAAGIDLLHVPFRGSGELTPALLGDQIDVIIDGVGLPLVKAGRAVGLAAYSPTRHPELPDMPSIIETGVEIELPTGGWGVMAPRGTPPEIVAQLTAALDQIVHAPATREQLLRVGVVAAWTPPQGYRDGLTKARAFYSQLLPAIGQQPAK
jgi:tripartite-type tricarboxylate transporter receptor subunit TctC